MSLGFSPATNSWYLSMYSESSIDAAQGHIQRTPVCVRVWDLPTRVFHWTLVALVIALFITGKVGDSAMIWHARAAFWVACLVTFRVLWGIWGGHWSRFSHFALSGSALRTQLTTNALWVGHSPTGSLSIVCMILVLAAQLVSGALSADKGDFFGPFTLFVSDDVVRSFTWYHKNVGQFALIALVSLHVAAIVYYQCFKGISLTRPMVVGDKRLNEPAVNSRDDGTSRGFAFALLCLTALAFALVLNSLGG